MASEEVALIAAAIFGYAIVSRQTGRVAVTMPMIFVALGSMAKATGVVELELEIEGVSLLGEATLAIILFSDASRIKTSRLRKDVGLPARLLGIGLPLSLLLGTIGVWLLLDSLSIWAAALVAAIVAPTDAALGQAVVEDRSVPLRVRQGLIVESGLNDGLVLPAVLLFLALATGEEAESGFWVRFVTQQIVLGIIVGIVVGAAGGWILHRARWSGWVEGVAAQLGVLALAVMALTVATAVDANGFIAAFVAGLAFGKVVPDKEAALLDEYTEDTGRLLAMISFFAFGNLLLNDALTNPAPRVLLCAVLALTLGRMIPVALAIMDMRPAPQTVLFVGWFGPRGLASVLFGILILEEDLPGGEDLFNVIAWTVLLSVMLHGATAGIGARRYGAWFRDMPDRDEMPEAVEVGERRTRWSRS